MTPLLVLLFNVHPATAVGTDLLYAAITKSAGTAVHNHNKTVNWRIVGTLALGSIPAALVTLYLMSGVNRDSLSFKAVLTHSLGWMLFLTAILLIFRKPIIDKVANWRRHHKPIEQSTIAAGTLAKSTTVPPYSMLNCMTRTVMGSTTASGVSPDSVHAASPPTNSKENPAAATLDIWLTCRTLAVPTPLGATTRSLQMTELLQSHQIPQSTVTL